MAKLWYILTHEWNLARIVRLGLGLMIVWQSVLVHDQLMMAMGGMFTLMAMFTTGCCGVAGCTTDKSNNSDIENNQNEITYEEIK